MQITANKVALIHYTLTNDAGTVLDSSEGREPLAYLHGANNIIPGLEKELEGKSAGDKLTAKIAAAEGYGERSEELVQDVPMAAFEGVDNVAAGMQFHAEGPAGPVLVTVTKVEGDIVTVDGNHPLAGETLNFDVEIAEVRDATADELEHGHVHGAHGVHD